MVITLILIWISIFDIKFHRIPNTSLIALIVTSLVISDAKLDLKFLLETSLLVFLFTWISNCGFGDSKLSIILLNLNVPKSQIFDYLTLLLLTSGFMVILHIFHHRTFRGHIAFAPALCGAVLALRWQGHY